MPLEIRELIIKARIDTGDEGSVSPPSTEAWRALKEQLLKETCERLEEIIEAKGER